jgi:hypothetical protein
MDPVKGVLVALPQIERAGTEWIFRERLLRSCTKRPHGRCGPEERDEFAAEPSVLAVFVLTTISNLVGRSIGKSDGRAPGAKGGSTIRRWAARVAGSLPRST